MAKKQKKSVPTEIPVKLTNLASARTISSPISREEVAMLVSKSFQAKISAEVARMEKEVNTIYNQLVAEVEEKERKILTQIEEVISPILQKNGLSAHLRPSVIIGVKTALQSSNCFIGVYVDRIEHKSELGFKYRSLRRKMNRLNDLSRTRFSRDGILMNLIYTQAQKDPETSLALGTIENLCHSVLSDALKDQPSDLDDTQG